MTTITLSADLSQIASQHAALQRTEQDTRDDDESDHAAAIRAVDAFVEQHRAEVALLGRLVKAMPHDGQILCADGEVYSIGGWQPQQLVRLVDEPALARIFAEALTGGARTAAEGDALDSWQRRQAGDLPLVDVPLEERGLPPEVVRDVRTLACALASVQTERSRRRGAAVQVEVPPGDEDVPGLVAWGPSGNAVEVVEQ